MNGSQVLSVAGELAGMLSRLAELPASVDDDAARIDVIAGLERLKAAVAAAQARVTEQFAVSQEAANRGLGFEARAARRGVSEQVGLARRVSPASASRQVTQAKALVRELPRVLGLLQAGEISELVAALVVNETAVLAAADRRAADARIAARLRGLGVKQAVAVARRTVIELDQQAVVDRAAKAREDQRVGCRPAPDTMAVLSALLPCEDGVRAYATLRAHADTIKTAGDPRSRGQIMADTLVERVTGHTPAAGGPVEIGLVMTDATLFAGEPTAAELNGYGPIPGPVARDIICRATGATEHDETNPDHGHDTSSSSASADASSTGTSGSSASADASSTGTSGSGTGVKGVAVTQHRGDRASGSRTGTGEAAVAAKAAAWIRRLYTDPATGTVTAVDPRRRRFTGHLAAYLIYRDQYCRTPYCEAPIRQLDHIRPHAAGGPTSADNGAGTCERCNYVKQMPGWTVRVIDPDRHIVETTTPTGHTYRSHPPAAPGHQPPATPDDQTNHHSRRADDHSSRSRPPPQAA